MSIHILHDKTESLDVGMSNEQNIFHFSIVTPSIPFLVGSNLFHAFRIMQIGCWTGTMKQYRFCLFQKAPMFIAIAAMANENNNNDDGGENSVKDYKECLLDGWICSTFVESTRCT